MEQDINKLIEELTKVRPDELSTEGLKLFNKINEIIDKNKELEEKEALVETVSQLTKENSELKDIIREHTLLISPYYVAQNYIPVSLVEEKIEELDIKITYIESQYTNGGQNCDKNYLSALYQKQVLQELLEKRKYKWMEMIMDL